jgi:fumarate reductase subunit C
LPEADFADGRYRGIEEGGFPRGTEGNALNFRTQSFLWVAQRASAVVLALCVTVHLATMIYAIRGGLSATEILSRTKGNLGWLAFYTVFVLAVTLHAPIGLRSVLLDWFGWRSASRDVFLVAVAMLLAVLGMRAVFGVFL